MIGLRTAFPLWRTGPAAIARPVSAINDALFGLRGCLLTFHRAAPSPLWEQLPNRNFYIELGFLDRLLDYLVRTDWAVVTLDEALRRAAGDGTAGRFVNFSIDDCYRDTFEAVVPLFRRHRVPVTLFVTTGIPDGTLPMWWIGLEEALLQRDQVLDRGATVLADTPEAKRQSFARIAADWEGNDPWTSYAAFCADNNIDAQAVYRRHAITWEMLEALRDDPFVEIGAHTVTHARISALPADAARAEIAESRERLVTRLRLPIRHFAFPYGRSGDCGQRDFELVREAGFASAATTRKGLVRRQQDAFSLPRNTLNGAHQNMMAVEMHLSGATGLVAGVLGRV